MSQANILQINSSGRYQDSLTRQAASLMVKTLKQQHEETTVVDRDLASGLPFVDEAWINANFTDSTSRSAEQKACLTFSDNLVAELQQASHFVIASPIYNFNIPAVLKAWIDQIARVGLTFRYTENGPIGLLENKQAIVLMASGGVPIGSEMDMASTYLKQVLGFIGVIDVTIIDAATLNEANIETFI